MGTRGWKQTEGFTKQLLANLDSLKSTLEGSGLSNITNAGVLADNAAQYLVKGELSGLMFKLLAMEGSLKTLLVNLDIHKVKMPAYLEKLVKRRKYLSSVVIEVCINADKTCGPFECIKRWLPVALPLQTVKYLYPGKTNCKLKPLKTSPITTTDYDTWKDPQTTNHTDEQNKVMEKERQQKLLEKKLDELRNVLEELMAVKVTLDDFENGLDSAKNELSKVLSRVRDMVDSVLHASRFENMQLSLEGPVEIISIRDGGKSAQALIRRTRNLKSGLDRGMKLIALSEALLLKVKKALDDFDCPLARAYENRWVHPRTATKG